MDKKRLGDIATYINGYAFKPSDWRNKGLPIIRIQDLTGTSYQLNFYDGEYSGKIEINNGDVLISWSGSLGIYIWNSGKALLNQHIFKVEFNKIQIDKQYFVYAVKYNLATMISKMHGATMKHIVKKDFDNIKVPYPSIKEQKEFVNRLLKIESAIDVRKQQLEALDTLIKARFVEMFGDPVSNLLCWDKVILSDLAEIRIGPFGSLLHKEDYVVGGHPLVNPSHIEDGRIVIDNRLTITSERYSQMEAYHLQVGDVVMGRRGEMGRCAVVTKNGLLCGTGSLIIRSNGEVRPDYIQKIISFPSFKRVIEDMAVGQTMQNLNVPIVSKLQIIKPPLCLQNQFAAFVAQTDKSKAVIQKSLEEIQLLFDSLMQEYFG